MLQVINNYLLKISYKLFKKSQTVINKNNFFDLKYVAKVMNDKHNIYIYNLIDIFIIGWRCICLQNLE